MKLLSELPIFGKLKQIPSTIWISWSLYWELTGFEPVAYECILRGMEYLSSYSKYYSTD